MINFSKRNYIHHYFAYSYAELVCNLHAWKVRHAIVIGINRFSHRRWIYQFSHLERSHENQDYRMF